MATFDNAFKGSAVLLKKSSMREIVNKAIESGGLIPHINEKGQSTYFAQVTGHDFMIETSLDFVFVQHVEQQEPYMYPSEEIVSGWFNPKEGSYCARARGFTQDDAFIVETIYDEELQMVMP